MPAFRARIMAPVLVALALGGCEAMERMDYLDRFFEEPRQTEVAAAEQPPTVRPAPRTAPTGPTTSGLTRVAMPPGAADDEGWTTPASSVVAMEPRPNPPVAERAVPAARPRGTEAGLAAAETDVAAQSRTHQVVRQNQWLTRFWMELTPEQQARVERQLHRGPTRLASSRSDPAGAWDSMGLSDRVRLLFGRGGQGAPEAPMPDSDRTGDTWAHNP